MSGLLKKLDRLQFKAWWESDAGMVFQEMLKRDRYQASEAILNRNIEFSDPHKATLATRAQGVTNFIDDRFLEDPEKMFTLLQNIANEE